MRLQSWPESEYRNGEVVSYGMTMRSLLRVATASIPLALVPVLVQLIGSGALDLGGGEKDLVWVLPWLLWSLLFAASSLILWHRGWSLSHSTVLSAVVGLAGVLLAAVLLAIFGLLGIGGRF